MTTTGLAITVRYILLEYIYSWMPQCNTIQYQSTLYTNKVSFLYISLCLMDIILDPPRTLSNTKTVRLIHATNCDQNSKLRRRGRTTKALCIYEDMLLPYGPFFVLPKLILQRSTLTNYEFTTWVQFGHSPKLYGSEVFKHIRSYIIYILIRLYIRSYVETR